MNAEITFQWRDGEKEVLYELEGAPVIGQGLLHGDMRFQIVEVQTRLGQDGLPYRIYALEESYAREIWTVSPSSF